MTADGETLGEFTGYSVEFDGGEAVEPAPMMDWGGTVEAGLSFEDWFKLRTQIELRAINGRQVIAVRIAMNRFVYAVDIESRARMRKAMPEYRRRKGRSKR